MDVKDLTGGSELVVQERPSVVHRVQKDEIYDAELVSDVGERESHEVCDEAKAVYERSSYVGPETTGRSYDFVNRFGPSTSERYGMMQGVVAMKYADQNQEENAQDFLKGRMGDHLATSC
jgi:hypothetical protein